jgi:hypothetical protein
MKFKDNRITPSSLFKNHPNISEHKGHFKWNGADRDRSRYGLPARSSGSNAISSFNNTIDETIIEKKI